MLFQGVVIPKEWGHIVRHKKHFILNFLSSIVKNFEHPFFPNEARSSNAPAGQASTHKPS